MTAQNSISKKSYFGSYFRYKLVKNKNLLILSFILSLLAIPLFAVCSCVCTGMLNDFIKIGVYAPDNVSEILGTVDTIIVSGSVIAAASCVILLVMTFVVSNTMFNYNLRKCDGDMYLSLPLTATQRFFADLLSGSVICILPVLLTGAVSAVVTSVSKITLSDKITEVFNNGDCSPAVESFYLSANSILYKNVADVTLYLMIVSVIILTLVYAFSVMINACTGRTADSVIYSVLGMLVIALFMFSVISILKGRLATVSTDEEIFSLAMLAAPLGPVFSFVGSLLNAFMHEKSGFNTEYDMFSVFSVRNMTLLAVSLIIYLVIAYLATRFRKAEKTGSPFVFELPYHIITLGLVASLFANITGTTGLNSHNTTSFIVCLVISIILYLLAELTHGRKLKKLWLSFIRYACAVVGSLLLCFVMRSYDIFGLEHYVPPAFFVDSVSISTTKAFNEFCTANGTMDYGFQTFDDEKSIKAITDYHSFIVNNGYGYAAGDGIIHFIESPREEHCDHSFVNIKYKLKDGGYLIRSFDINVSEDNSGEYAKKLYDMRYALSDSDGYKPFFEYLRTSQWGWDITIHQNDGELYGRTLKSELNTKLLNALENDMKAGRNNGKLAAVLGFIPAGATYSNIRIDIRENCTETLAILAATDNSVSRKDAIVGMMQSSKRESENNQNEGNEDGMISGDSDYYTVAEEYRTYSIAKTLTPCHVWYGSDDVTVNNADVIPVDCDMAYSDAVNEFEKLCKLYDFYTDGVLSDKSYVLTSPEMDAFAGAIYYIPDGNVSRAEELFKTISEEYHNMSRQSSQSN